MEVTPLRYTESQILFGLREAWLNITGVDDPFDVATRLDVYMKSDGTWDEIDFVDIFRGLEDFFGFACSDDEWKQFFEWDVADDSLQEWDRVVAPRLTFGALARFIADRTDAIALKPVTVFGRECRPAGVFMGIQQVVNGVHGRSIRFAPSTRIIDVLRGGALDRFWTQLRWMTQHSMPELPAFWRNVTGNTACFGVLGACVTLPAAAIIGSITYLIPAVLIFALPYAIATILKHCVNPLPAEITTFRDLSLLVANSDCDAVRG